MLVSAQAEIGVVLYLGVQMACVHGLTDLFGVAANVTLDRRRIGRPLRVTHWEATHADDANLSCVYDSDQRSSPEPLILIVPPTMVDLPNPAVPTGAVSA